MASWNIPALVNAIKNDIVGLGSLLRSLAIGDPSAGNTDMPAQSKRMQEGTDGWEWQMFNGQVWNRLAKWNLNAAQVDGFDASAGTTANTIPVRDKNGDLPGNVLGNAATATKAAALSAVNPIPMGGTGATTPQQARQNLGTPPTDHSSSGTEFGLGTSVKHGHTKLSDATDSSSDTSGGTAATPKAVKTVADSVAALKAEVEADFAATASAQAESDAAQNAAIAAAQTSANNAQTSADNAQQSANAAQTSANAAATEAQNVAASLNSRIDALIPTIPAKANAYIVNSYHSGTEWYRKYSDGWIEQGGHVSVSHSVSTQTKNLVTAFTSTNYCIYAAAYGNGKFNDNVNLVAKSTTTFGIAAGTESSGGNAPNGAYWFACGK